MEAVMEAEMEAEMVAEMNEWFWGWSVRFLDVPGVVVLCLWEILFVHCVELVLEVA